MTLCTRKTSKNAKRAAGERKKSEEKNSRVSFKNPRNESRLSCKSTQIFREMTGCNIVKVSKWEKSKQF